MTDGAESRAPEPRRRWWRRQPAGPPAPDGRAWIHPSELPSFDRIKEYDPSSSFRHRTVVVVAMGMVLVALATTLLALRTSTPPVTGRLDRYASTVSQLPDYARAAARSTVELVVAADGHVTAVAAMVISPGTLAVTTDPIPPNATIVGSSVRDARFPVTFVSYNSTLGFSVVRLSRSQPVTPTAQLPASSTVLAISPYFTPSSIKPEIAYATTTLADPVLKEADGVVSYLATPPDANLDGLVDALAVDQSGDVVAVLTGHDEWYSASYISTVAQVIERNGGCHAEIGIVYTTASDGGVQILKVLKGPAKGSLWPGDILTSVNGVDLDSMYALQAYLYASPAPRRLDFGLERDGRTTSAVVRAACEP